MKASPASPTVLAPAVRRFFPPEVALHATRLACQRPDDLGRSLSLWTCGQLAQQLEDDGVTSSISAESVRRMLQSAKLRPWRVHLWMHPKGERDEAFYEATRRIADLYSRPLDAHERVLSVDEKTSLQPRPRRTPTRPAQPNKPVQLEHEYQRAGALHLFAAFDTRTGKVLGRCYDRKRQDELLDFLAYLDADIPASVTRVYLVLDNVSYHHGKRVRAWLAAHPRFVFVFTPVHCSWMNQVEQWFGLLQRERLRLSDFPSKADLAAKIAAYIAQYNPTSHPFAWSKRSFRKVLPELQEAAA